MEIDFYHHNDRIAFPLVSYASMLTLSAGYVLPRLGLVDAGFVMGPAANFSAIKNVTLYSVVLASPNVTFVFRSDAPGAAGYEIRFEFNTSTPFGCSLRAEANTIGLSDSHPEVMAGFLTVGDLSAIATAPNATYVLATSVPVLAHVEKALIQNLKNTFVNSIKIANDARRCPVGCCQELVDHAVNTFATNGGVGLVGNITLTPGYSAVVDMQHTGNQIVIGAIKGAGAGQACADILITEDGMQNDPDEHGVPQCESCDDLISSINGIVFPGGKVLLKSGSGITIEPDPSRHLLHVRFKDGVSSS